MKYNENTIATVGDRLKTLRKKRGYSAESLAEIMGCSEKTIRNRESCQIAPLEELLKYCDVLDCDMGYLLWQYEEKDSDTFFIASKTGLSEEAIEHLIDNVSYDDIVTEIGMINNEITINEITQSSFTFTANTENKCVNCVVLRALKSGNTAIKIEEKGHLYIREAVCCEVK